MKKTVRRILAAIMVLAMIFACVPTAFAATASSDNYYDVVSGTGYDDVMRIPYGKLQHSSSSQYQVQKAFVVIQPMIQS